MMAGWCDHELEVQLGRWSAQEASEAEKYRVRGSDGDTDVSGYCGGRRRFIVGFAGHELCRAGWVGEMNEPGREVEAWEQSSGLPWLL